MATSKFKTTSPYFNIKSKQHHRSDYLYQKFDDSFKDTKTYKNLKAIGFALFGIGRAGTIHLNNLLSNRRGKILYIVDPDRKRWEVCQSSLNLDEHVQFLVPEDASKVYQDKAVEAVIVATPTFTHEKFSMASLKAGKAVLSEKPLAETEEATRRIFKMAEENSRPLLVAFNRRFDPSNKDLFDRVRQGEVGHVQHVRMVSRDSSLPSLNYLKISGGIYHDCVVHNIDQMTWILGELPEEVFSAATAEIPEIKAIDDFDNLTCTLKFPSGTIGTMEIGRYASYGYDQRVEVMGPKGMLEIKNGSPNNTISYTSEGIEGAPMFWSFPSRFSQGYINELDHFIDVVQGQDECSVTCQMTLSTTKIANALEESAREGRAIKLKWSDEEIPKGYFT